jgi:ribose transport system ATP-binding protein
MTGESAPTPAIGAYGIRKVYGPTVALAGVDFEVAPGEIHGLLGENGAGKSTLVRILAGVEKADGGALGFFGSPAHGGPVERRAAGVAVIHQDLGLFEELSAAENIALESGFHRRAGFISDRATMRSARAVVERVGLDVDVRRPVGELPPAEQTVVAICRALSGGARIIILDEPTAYLEARQVRALFDLLATLRRDGVACVLISHRSEDVLRVCDRVTVLRDGRHVALRHAADLTEAELVRLITGRTGRAPSQVIGGAYVQNGTSRMSVRGLAGTGFGPISFDVGVGEVVGLCGLADAGQRGVGEALFGLAPIRGGDVELDGAPVKLTGVRQALAAGIGIVPARRMRDGLAGSLTASENLHMKPVGAWWRPVMRADEERESRERLDRYQVNPPDPDREVVTFSGGNQQKILLAKWLGRGRRLLLLDEPSAGVDVGAKADIHRQIRQDCEETGASAVVISTDFQEIVDLCDRALVMRRGAIVAGVTKSELQADLLTELAYGGAP